MKHGPFPKYGMIYRPGMYNLHFPKKHLEELNSISTLPKYIKWSEIICIICRLNLHTLKTIKKLKMSLIVRIKLSINENTKNENTKRPQT